MRTFFSGDKQEEEALITIKLYNYQIVFVYWGVTECTQGNHMLYE